MARIPQEKAEQLRGWFAGRIPDGWFTGPPDVTVDQDEILIVGELKSPSVGDDATEAERAAAAQGRIKQFREDTRDERVAIAVEAEHRFGRKVSWGARVGEISRLFTHLAAPVMTRLRQPERLVLDTLVDSGVARSRSDALAWCVRLVGRHEDDWLSELREALTSVDKVRAKGPSAA